jgi:hypothetical protein
MSENGNIILGPLVASGSILTREQFAFGNFQGVNFEPVSIVENADAIMEHVTSTIGSNSATLVDTFNTSSFNGAIYDYVLLDTTVGCRTGQFLVTQDNNSIDFTDVSTNDVGNDSPKPSLSAAFNGSNVEVKVTNGDGYTFKSIAKKI